MTTRHHIIILSILYTGVLIASISVAIWYASVHSYKNTVDEYFENISTSMVREFVDAKCE